MGFASCGCQRVRYYSSPSTIDIVRQPICLECAFRANPDGLVLPGVACPSTNPMGPPEPFVMFNVMGSCRPSLPVVRA
jgi:hypothetical protein